MDFRAGGCGDRELRERLGPAGPERPAAETVDRLVPRRLHEPARRVRGSPVARPLLQRGGKCLLHHLLGEVEVAEHADQRREDSRRGVAVEVTEFQVSVSHHPVIRDQHPGDRAQGTAVEAEPGEDVDVRVCIEPPRLDQDPQNSCDQPSCPKADPFRNGIREIVRGADDVRRDIDGQCGDREGKQRQHDDNRIVEFRREDDRIPDGLAIDHHGGRRNQHGQQREDRHRRR